MTECSLCDSRDGVESQLVEYATPYPAGKRFDTVPRCIDRVACRGRVEAKGLRWTLLDGTPSPTPVVQVDEDRPDPGDASRPAAAHGSLPPEEDLLEIETW